MTTQVLYTRRPNAQRNDDYAEEWFNNLDKGDQVRAGNQVGVLIEITHGPDRSRHTATAAIRTDESTTIVAARTLMPAEPEQIYTHADWAREAVAGDTRLGYDEWVEHALEADGFVLAPV